MPKLRMLTTSSSHRSARRRQGAGRLLFCLLASVLLGLASPAFAQEIQRQDDKDTIHVIQRKPVLQDGRLDLVPRFGMSVNDSMYRQFKVGLNANYHLTESLYLGGLFEWFDFGDVLGGPTAAFKSAQNATRATTDAAVVNWAGGLELGYMPIVGKFAFADSFIIFYDMGITVGGVYLNAESIALPATQDLIGGTASLVTRVFFNDWLALNLEVRDMIFSADLRGQQGALVNLVTVAAGFSFYFPTAFEYRDGGE